METLDQGQQENAASNGSKFKVLRFYLDNARTRFFTGVTDHVFGSGIKSFWVCATNNRSFVAEIVPNYRSDRNETSGLPLRFNMNQKFSSPVNDACLEFPAQSGVWIDIAFSESEDISIGSSDIALSGSVAPDEGSTYVMAKKTATTSPVILLAADTLRLKAVLQHKSGGPIWVGSSSDLSNADYQNMTLQINAGDTIEWWNRGALYFRDSGTGSIILTTSFSA